MALVDDSLHKAQLNFPHLLNHLESIFLNPHAMSHLNPILFFHLNRAILPTILNTSHFPPTIPPRIPHKLPLLTPSKKIKLTIIPYRQLFVNISSDEDVTTTPSPTTTSSSPTPLNAPSKTPSTNQTSSSQENTSSSFQSKLQICTPPSSNEPTSPQPLIPFA
ncbi:hypothetical protein Tco_0030816 [Tanacetum coccineum]